MLTWCRIALAATMALSAAGIAVAGGEAEGGLESRLRALDARFGQRQQHSEAALRLRPVDQTVRAALNDFIVNNDGFGGASNQWQLVLARQPDGGTIAVWTDDRDANLSVYGQVFDSLGTPLGPNFRLHPDPGNRDQQDPAIVVRSDGGFYGAFTDVKADGDEDVIVQRFSRLGQRLGAQANAADPADTADFLQRRPALTLLSSGDVVVLYERDDASDPNSDIYGQLIAAEAPLRIGESFVVSADLEGGGGAVLYDEREPWVAAGGNDTIWAVWTDNRDGGARDVFVQRLFQVATDTVARIGAVNKVNDEPVSANAFQNSPRVVASNNGDAFMAWADFRNGNWDMYMQSYAASGAKQGVNTRINSDATPASQGSPALVLRDTVAVGVWVDFREGDSRVYAQRFRFYDSVYVTNASLVPSYDSVMITNAQIDDLGGGNYQQCDSIWIIRYVESDTLFRNTNCGVTTTPDSTRDTTVYEFFRVCDSVWVAGTGRLVNCDTIPEADTAGLVQTTTLSKTSGPEGTDFAVGAAGTGNQSYAAVGLSPNGVFSAGWTQPDSLATAYFRLVDAANVLDTPIIAAEIVISAKQVKPACAIGSGGDIFTVWEESRAALPNIVGQALDASLNKPQGDRQVNNGPDVFHFLPTTAVGGTIGFTVWEDYRDTIQPVYSDIYLQRYSLTAAGYTAEGTNVRVIDTVESQEVRLSSWNPDIASDDNGNALVVWQDNRFDSWDVFAARYSDSVNPVTGDPVRQGTNFRIDEAPYFTPQTLPRIDMNGTGQTVVVWEDTRTGPYDPEIWARLYTGAGLTPSGGEFQPATDSTHTPRQPDAAMAADGSFAVVYEDHSNPLDVDIYFQRFTAAGDTVAGALGDPILINDDGLAVQQFLPRIAATAQGYVVVWQDERSGNWDIYASLIPTPASAANPNYLVNDAETTDQTVPAIAARRADSDPFICWEDLRLPNTAPDILGNRNTPSLATGIGDDPEDGAVLPGRFGLDQNYPNPFNPATEIRYVLPAPARVELTVYNTLGQRVRTLVATNQTSGEHRIVWDGYDESGQAVASGTYFYRLRWPEGEITRKMTLLR